MSLLDLVVISGIFSREKDLDILPPPPPFPELDVIDADFGERGDERKAYGNTKQKEIEQKKKLEQEKLKQEEKTKSREEKRSTHEEKIRKRRKQISEAEIEGQKTEEKPLEEVRLIPEEKPAKKTIFESIFGKKEDRFAKELEELDEIGKEPVKINEEYEIQELKNPDDYGFSKEAKIPEERVKDEKEIQDAIEGIKKKEKKPSILRKLFKSREKEERVLETPGIMPSFDEKADEVETIEEKLHKARLALMDFKFDEAKKIYIDIMRIYNGVDNKKKSRVYQDIKDLYYERKTAEKYSK